MSFSEILVPFNDFFDFLMFSRVPFFTPDDFYDTKTFFMPEFWNETTSFDELRFFFDFLLLFDLDFSFELEFYPDFNLALLCVISLNFLL